MSTRRRTSSVLVATSAIAWSVTGCSLDETTPAPSCDALSSIVIVAQSVPRAGFVPCVEDLGSGWRTTRVHVDEEGTRMRFALGFEERASAHLVFTASCNGETGRRIESEVDGVDARALPAAGRRYSFDGGCVVVRFDGAAVDAEVEVLLQSVVLVDRGRLATEIRRTSVDAEV